MPVATWMQIHYWKDTRTVFERAVQVTQNNYLALTLLGEHRATNGDLDGALELYREALRDKPNYSEAHFFLARGLEQQGKVDEAKSETPGPALASIVRTGAHFLGLLLAREKKYDQAAAEYQTVLKTNPRSATAHNDLARLLQTEGRLDESVRHYLAAVHFDSSPAQAHNNLGVLYLQKGQLADGITQLREALRLNPGNVETNIIWPWAPFSNSSERSRKHSSALRQRGRAMPMRIPIWIGAGPSREIREAISHTAELGRGGRTSPKPAARWLDRRDRPHPELRNGPQAVATAGRACELTGRQQPAMLLTLAAA